MSKLLPDLVLILRLTKRDILTRYRGSFLGLAWSVLLPLTMLAVYTFVFSFVFKARWGELDQSRGTFALILFSGLILFNLFAESINRAPVILLENINYIKKVVFPLRILPCVLVLVAFFNSLVSFAVLLVGYFFIIGWPPLTIFLWPLVVLPILLMSYGISSFLASVGVFVRDVRHIVGVLTTIILFLSPVFYPITSLPEHYRRWLALNPLTEALEASRQVLFANQIPDLREQAIYLGISLIIAFFGYHWFERTKKGFADVV